MLNGGKFLSSPIFTCIYTPQVDPVTGMVMNITDLKQAMEVCVCVCVCVCDNTRKCILFLPYRKLSWSTWITNTWIKMYHTSKIMSGESSWQWFQQLDQSISPRYSSPFAPHPPPSLSSQHFRKLGYFYLAAAVADSRGQRSPAVRSLGRRDS